MINTTQRLTKIAIIGTGRVGASCAPTMPDSDIVPASMTGTRAASTPGIS